MVKWLNNIINIRVPTKEEMEEIEFNKAKDSVTPPVWEFVKAFKESFYKRDNRFKVKISDLPYNSMYSSRGRHIKITDTKTKVVVDCIGAIFKYDNKGFTGEIQSSGRLVLIVNGEEWKDVHGVLWASREISKLYYKRRLRLYEIREQREKRKQDKIRNEVVKLYVEQ